MASRIMQCRTCDGMRLFEQPPCAQDGGHEHDADCREWLCTGCGEALLVAPMTVAAVPVTRSGGGRVAPHRRRAA